MYLKDTEIAPAALALEDKPFLLLVSSQRHTQLCWSSQVSQHQLEQILHQHLSRKFSTQPLNSTVPEHRSFQGDTAGLPKQASVFFLSVAKCFSSQKLDHCNLFQLEYIFCALPAFPQTFSNCFGEFPVMVSLWRKLHSLLFERVPLPKTQTHILLFGASSDAA